MLSVGGAGSSIAFLTFEGGFPLRLEREGANVTLHRFVARDGAWKRPVLYAHLYGNRDEEFWSEAEAVRRAKDEIIVALLDVQRAASHDLDLAAYLRTFKERTVLVLGDFKQGRARLDAIRTSLADRGYEPVLLDEVPDDLNYDLPQKFLAVASVCAF